MTTDAPTVPTVPTVRELIGVQFPELRDLPVRRLPSHGTVNTVFRVGDRLSARFPLEPGEPGAARQRLEQEARAARELLHRTRFRTPEPIAVGGPGPGYASSWSLQTWLPGTVATDEDPGGSVDFARDLAEFIAGVRAIDPAGRTFRGSGRGGDLRDHDAWVETCLRRSEGLLDVPRLRRLWSALRELPRDDRPDTMNHGDLMPGNLLVAGARLTGVLDVGGLGPADPALDLVGAWHLLEAGPRRTLRDELGGTELEWERGRAWAFEQALGLVWYYRETNPPMSATGRRTLTRILAS